MRSLRDNLNCDNNWYTNDKIQFRHKLGELFICIQIFRNKCHWENVILGQWHVFFDKFIGRVSIWTLLKLDVIYILLGGNIFFGINNIGIPKKKKWENW